MRRSDGSAENTFELENAMGQLDLKVATSDVESIQVTIKGSYPGSLPGSGTAIGEVEVYVRQ